MKLAPLRVALVPNGPARRTGIALELSGFDEALAELRALVDAEIEQQRAGGAL